MKVIDPFLDGEGVWQGDSPGTMRKRFQCFGIKNSVDFCSNVTVVRTWGGERVPQPPLL